MFHTLSDFFLDEYHFFKLHKKCGIEYDLKGALDSLEIESPSLSTEDFVSRIAVADYFLFRNKETYLQQENDLYYMCDPIVLNLYLNKLNYFKTQLTEKRENLEIYWSLRVLLDFLNHFLWWNVDWNALTQHNKLVVKSQVVRDYICDLEGSNFHLLIHCIQWIGSSCTLANMPLKKVCWLLYLSFVHLFDTVEEEYHDNIYNRHYFKDKKYINKKILEQLVNDAKNKDIFMDYNDKDFEYMKNKPSTLSSYNQHYLMPNNKVFSFFMNIYGSILPDMIVAMLRGIYRSCQNSKASTESNCLDINSEWYIVYEILNKFEFFEEFEDSAYRLSYFTKNVKLEDIQELLVNYDNNNYLINNKSYSPELSQMKNMFELAEVNRHYLLVCSICTTNFRYMIQKLERVNVLLKEYCHYLILEASGLFVYLKIFNLYSCMGNEHLMNYLDNCFDNNMAVPPKFHGDWTCSSIYMYSECIASSLNFVYSLCHYYPYRIEEYISKYGMIRIFLLILDTFFSLNNSHILGKADKKHYQNLKNPTLAIEFIKIGYLYLKYNKQYPRSRENQRVLTLCYLWLKYDDPYYLVNYDKTQLLDNYLNNHIQDKEHYCLHADLSQYFTNHFKEVLFEFFGNDKDESRKLDQITAYYTDYF